MPDRPCSTLSADHEEALAGSAVADTPRWLLLEHRAPWSAQGFPDVGLPPAVVSHLVAGSAGARVQLVRQPQRRDGPLVVMAADVTAGTLRRLEVEEGWLGGVDLAGLWAGTSGEPVDGPVVLVCTHGRRDPCCARLGVPVWQALTESGVAAWQVSHLGGHRFAATLLVLPDGVCYGRVEPSEAASLAEAHRAGRWHRPDRVRGRVDRSAWAQVAEVSARTASGVLGCEAARVVEEPLDALTRRVRVELNGQVQELVVRQGRQAVAAPSSCGAEPKRSPRFEVVGT